MQHIGNLRELLDGLGKVFDILDKRLNVADGNDAAGGKDAAHNGDCHIPKVADKVHNRHHHTGQELRFPRRFVQFFVGGVEVVQHGGFAVERLDDVMPGVDFLDLTVDNAQGRLLCLEIFLAELDHNQHQRQRDRQNQQRNQRHFGADGQHHDQHADHGGDAGDQLGNALVQALPQGVHIVGNAGKHLTHRAFFKIGKRQPVDFFADAVAEVIADLLRKPGHQPALDKAERGAEQIHPQQEQQHLADVGKVNAADAAQLSDPAGGQCGGSFCQHLGSGNVKNGR